VIFFSLPWEIIYAARHPHAPSKKGITELPDQRYDTVKPLLG